MKKSSGGLLIDNLQKEILAIYQNQNQTQIIIPSKRRVWFWYITSPPLGADHFCSWSRSTSVLIFGHPDCVFHLVLVSFPFLIHASSTPLPSGWFSQLDIWLKLGQVCSLSWEFESKTSNWPNQIELGLHFNVILNCGLNTWQPRAFFNLES